MHNAAGAQHAVLAKGGTFEYYAVRSDEAAVADADGTFLDDLGTLRVAIGGGQRMEVVVDDLAVTGYEYIASYDDCYP